MHNIATATEPTTPNTEKIQKALEAIEDDLSGTVDGWFGEIHDSLTEIQEVLRSAALRKVLSELGKLRASLVDKMQSEVADVRAALEMHDCEVVDALETVEVEDAA